jgi:acyl-CoA reductase-like NAD-dependent aldehyde dehydrogenase
MGPLISASHRRRVLAHVAAARDDGAQIAVGGAEASPAGLEHGFFVEPTVVRGVSNAMRVAQEEIFGPVLSVISWRSDDDLAALANAVPYGLAAGIWTSDTSRALRLAEELDAGTVWINTYGMFDVAVPFGGRKHSGFGRELGEEALAPYLTSKSVWVDLQSGAAQAGQAISR